MSCGFSVGHVPDRSSRDQICGDLLGSHAVSIATTTGPTSSRGYCRWLRATRSTLAYMSALPLADRGESRFITTINIASSRGGAVVGYNVRKNASSCSR
jgi:hypothetical protein